MLKLLWRVASGSNPLSYAETREELLPYLDACHALRLDIQLNRLSVDDEWVVEPPFDAEERRELAELVSFASMRRKKLDDAGFELVTIPVALFTRLCVRSGVPVGD